MSAAEMLHLYELCGIQIGVTLAEESTPPTAACGLSSTQQKPSISSDPASPRKRNSEEIAANRARAIAKVRQLR